MRCSRKHSSGCWGGMASRSARSTPTKSSAWPVCFYVTLSCVRSPWIDGRQHDSAVLACWLKPGMAPPSGASIEARSACAPLMPRIRAVSQPRIIDLVSAARPGAPLSARLVCASLWDRVSSERALAAWAPQWNGRSPTDAFQWGVVQILAGGGARTVDDLVIRLKGPLPGNVQCETLYTSII